MKRIKPISVMSFLLLAVCGALCQSERPSADLLQGAEYDGPDSHELQRLESPTRKSFPDAPSAQPPTQVEKSRAFVDETRSPLTFGAAQPPTQAEKFRAFVDEARSPLTVGAAGVSTGIMHLTEVGGLSSGREASLTELYKGALIQKESSAFFSKYLYPALLKQDPRYHHSSSPSFWGRVMYAASRTIITPNDSGKATLNTSYFLGMLTSVAITTAYHPYWTRSTSATFKTFASTMGSDAGINILHEFEPGIRQIVNGHTPKFVSRIEERITNDQTDQILSDSSTTPR